MLEPAISNVLVVIFNPSMPDDRSLVESMDWHDPKTLIPTYISDLQECSHGYANYRVLETLTVDRFPVKLDGFRYSPLTFQTCWKNQAGFHAPDEVDYLSLVQNFNLTARVNSGEVDEIWLFGFPYAGFYESRMLGRKPFWYNAPALPLRGAKRRYVQMGFNYERGVGEMLEAFGHRVESTLTQVFRDQQGEANLWERFTRHQATQPGDAEVGSVHFAPNSLRDYDWGNPHRVPTRCRNWANFPDLSGVPIELNCSEWGNGDIRDHHRWWLGLLPHVDGAEHGIANNWWRYVFDPNLVK